MKVSAYQKLKAENLRLKQDIHTLVTLENSEKAEDVLKYWGTKITWDIKFNLENIEWGGNSTPKQDKP